MHQANSKNCFCSTYDIDSHRCTDELYSFATNFDKFIRSCYNTERDDESSESGNEENDAERETGAEKRHDDEENAAARDSSERPPSFIDAIEILANPSYHLVDAYPTLCKVYSITVAIPVSSATAERSFSALKRVKSKIRSMMLQNRLESLLLMTVEKKILLSLDKERVVDTFAGSSEELRKALL